MSHQLQSQSQGRPFSDLPHVYLQGAPQIRRGRQTIFLHLEARPHLPQPDFPRKTPAHLLSGEQRIQIPDGIGDSLN